MIIKEMEPLAPYTTFKMGGLARKMYFPEAKEELISLLNENENLANFLLGGGSNLIIDDKAEMDAVVCLRNFNDEINYIGDGEYEVGASVRLQKLITHVNSNGYGGIEYMYSIPGLLGGAIYMNAGTGRVTNKSIGNSIESVAVFYNGKLQEYSRDECQFGYRSSIFQKRPGSVILGAKLKFEPIDEDKAKSRIKERMDHCRETQDRSAPNVGTVFCESNDRIMNYFMKKGIGYVDGCVFSSKTKNWMLHREQGTFEQAMELIQRVQRAHRLFRKKCRTEVVIWK